MRIQSSPYTIVPSASTTPTIQHQTNRLLTTVNRHSTDTIATSCRCTSSALQQQHPHQHQSASEHHLLQSFGSTNQASSTTRNSTGSITTIAQIGQQSASIAQPPTHHHSASSVRSISSSSVSTTPNPMLLVPFAAVPGFVPIQNSTATATPAATASAGNAGTFGKVLVAFFRYI